MQETNQQQEVVKPKSGAGKILFRIFLILLSLFVVIAIAGGIARVVLNDNTLTLASLVKRMMGGVSLFQKNENVITASSAKSTVEISSKGDIKLTVMENSSWPKDAVGGLYKITPSEEFKEGVAFKMTLKETPPADFALGYWHPETKKWEWLPTAKISDVIFQTVLPHASVIGGGSGGACSSMPKDPENIQLYNEIKAEMNKIQIDQQTGEAAEINDASWKSAWEKAKEMTDKAINDYCKNKNLTNEYDFYAAWELVQCLGFPSLNDRFVNAWENKCEDPKKIKQYKIDQNDPVSATFSLNLGWFYQQNSSFNAKIYYTGFPQSLAPLGKSGWRTNWKVNVFTEGKGDINQTGHLQKGDVYYDLKALNTSAKTTDNWTWTFSLENVKEGEKFPIKAVRNGSYTSRLAGPNASIVLKSSNLNMNANAPMQGTDQIGPGQSMSFDGILSKDLGDAGAIITLSEDVNLTPEQKKALDQVIKLQKESGIPAISNMWDESGKNNLVKSDSKASPLRIVPIGTESEESNKEDDWKANEEDLSNSPSKKPNNKIPDLAPLPTPNDLDGDGVPDLVPLTPNN